MKKLALLAIPLLFSCTKETTEEKKCNINELLFPGATWTTNLNTPFPISSTNFWTYTDSTFNLGVYDTSQTSLMKIEQVYHVDDVFAIHFNTLLPLLIVENDTLFSGKFTPEQGVKDCYQKKYPMFFNTSDSVHVYNNISLRFSAATVHTAAGDFTNNIIYSDGKSRTIVFNPKVGIIKIIFKLYKDGSYVKAQTLTLKDYSLSE